MRHRYEAGRQSIAARAAQRFDAATAVLPDDVWEAIAPLLQRMRNPHAKTRQFIELIVFGAIRGFTLWAPPPAAKKIPHYVTSVQALVSNGSWDKILDNIRRINPDLARRIPERYMEKLNVLRSSSITRQSPAQLAQYVTELEALLPAADEEQKKVIKGCVLRMQGVKIVDLERHSGAAWSMINYALRRIFTLGASSVLVKRTGGNRSVASGEPFEEIIQLIHDNRKKGPSAEPLTADFLATLLFLKTDRRISRNQLTRRLRERGIYLKAGNATRDISKRQA